jgi:hypothetical protein
VKDQYFADKRDFFKWDFLEDLLDGCAELRRLTNVTMLTTADDSGEGALKPYEVGHRREPLYKFLKGCRTDSKQRVSEMRRYFQSKRFTYHPHRDSAENPYTYESREDYFGELPEDQLQQSLVFFDPDIGLQVRSMSYMRRSGISKYLFDESLKAVAGRVSDDSVIVVYQHLQRNRNRFWDDVKERCDRFRDLVGAKGAAFLTDRDIVFLASSRKPDVRLKMSNIVVTHAHKHDLDCGELTGG